MRKSIVLAFLVLAMLFASSSLHAVTLQLISHQGRLTTAAGVPVADGAYLMKFQIYGDSLGGVALWNSGFQSLQVAGGLFSYILGKDVLFPADLFTVSPDRWLGITVGVDPEITPRTRMVGSAYALHAFNAGAVSDNIITSAKIVNSTIVDADINSVANIAATKISGTAATLSATQTFTGTNTFDGSVIMGDSTLRASANGVQLGRASYAGGTALLALDRNYATNASRFGIDMSVYNSSNGSLTGIYSRVEHSTAGTAGVASAVTAYVYSDGVNRYGVHGVAQAKDPTITTGISYGLYGQAYDGATAYGVYGYGGSATNNWAGWFSGDVNVTGTLSKGGGAFRIDHPLDPENKYLQHSFVESPDMMNIYNGNITTDGRGYATVEMPSYFDALNRDFRYQLTVIGQFAQAIVSQEIADSRFIIQTDKPNVKVSWQVTGIRQDKWANSNRIQVELDKQPDQRGKYAHPTEWNQPREKGIDWENIKEAVLEHEARR
jgi:hypothetical protein